MRELGVAAAKDIQCRDADDEQSVWFQNTGKLVERRFFAPRGKMDKHIERSDAHETILMRNGRQAISAWDRRPMPAFRA